MMMGDDQMSIDDRLALVLPIILAANNSTHSMAWKCSATSLEQNIELVMVMMRLSVALLTHWLVVRNCQTMLIGQLCFAKSVRVVVHAIFEPGHLMGGLIDQTTVGRLRQSHKRVVGGWKQSIAFVRACLKSMVVVMVEWRFVAVVK